MGATYNDFSLLYSCIAAYTLNNIILFRTPLRSSQFVVGGSWTSGLQPARPATTNNKHLRSAAGVERSNRGEYID